MMRRILVGAALAGAVFGLSTVSAYADSGSSAYCTPKPTVATDCAPKPVIAVPCGTKVVTTTTTTQCTSCTTQCTTNHTTSSTATSSTATSSTSYVPAGNPVNTGTQVGSQWAAANDLVLLNDVANDSVKNINVLNVGQLHKVNVGVLNNHQASSTSVLAPC
ncbi:MULTISPECIES: hypothetical protein [unclassified Nonomuraea]|uniref:hypothetical protein n=1 Tax=unclassified Nonomuraea TaxID=2593643 RepID=UPI0033EE215D